MKHSIVLRPVDLGVLTEHDIGAIIELHRADLFVACLDLAGADDRAVPLIRAWGAAQRIAEFKNLLPTKASS